MSGEVGAGQTGLQIAARFCQNLRAIVVDQEARVGDVGRKRYPVLPHAPITAVSEYFQASPI